MKEECIEVGENLEEFINGGNGWRKVKGIIVNGEIGIGIDKRRRVWRCIEEEWWNGVRWRGCKRWKEDKGREGRFGRREGRGMEGILRCGRKRWWREGKREKGGRIIYGWRFSIGSIEGRGIVLRIGCRWRGGIGRGKME